MVDDLLGPLDHCGPGLGSTSQINAARQPESQVDIGPPILLAPCGRTQERSPVDLRVMTRDLDKTLPQLLPISDVEHHTSVRRQGTPAPGCGLDNTEAMDRLATRSVSLITALALALLALVIAPTSAYACSCMATTPARALRDSDVVFRGTVTEADLVRREGRRVDLRFQVEAVYKGEVYADQVVATEPNGGSCGLDATVGSTWVVFADQAVEGEGEDAVTRLVTDSCRGNLVKGQVPTVLGAPRPPVAGASDREERSARADRQVTRGVLIAGIGVLSFGLVAALALALAWRHGSARPKR